MAIFTAIAAAIGLTGFAAAAFTFVGRAILTIGISRLLARRAQKPASGGGEGGGRVQIPPATDNKIPVIYGNAFVGGPVTDAKISTDLKTMWYVVSLAEHTDTTIGSDYTFGNVYYDGKLVTFGTDGVVNSLTTNTTPAQVDDRVKDKLWIYLFNNGSASGTNTGGKTAQQIISTANGVPAGQEWTTTDAMTNCAFAIVKVVYNVDAGLTSLGSLTVQITNSINKPGDAILDYMLNTRYGCAIPIDRIDTASLTALNTYSDQTIIYEPVGGGTATQARYRVNGPLDTAQDCLTNLQFLVDTCDCWLQYSELIGRWKVVINQSYTDYTIFNDLFLVDSSNLVGGIDISPIDLNETYNELEVAYPNKNIKDQTDYQVVQLDDYQSGVMSPNEAINRLNVQLPLVNEAVQAKYLGVRRLLQSREDLVVTFSTDYSGIQVEAGDVIKITHEVYGWTDKLFRVSNVAEEKYPDGNLGAKIQAFEYNNTIYADNAIKDFVPAFNTGLKDPNVISQPTAPVITAGQVNNNGVNYFTVSSNVPTQGTVLYMDFNVGNNSNVLQHQRFTTITTSDGRPFVNSSNVANTTVNANVSTLPLGNYYFSATARNPFAGRQSNSSSILNWPGPGLTPNTTTTFCNASSNGNVVTTTAAVANLLVGANLTITSGNGVLAANTYVANITSNTQFILSAVPTTPLSNACLRATAGGITGNTIQPGTITGNNIANYTILGINIANLTITGNNIADGSICTDQLCSNITDALDIIQSTYSYVIVSNITNTVYPPVDITSLGNISTANFDTTKYLNVAYSGTLSSYPYFVGDSSTSEGYDANSTSSFYPAGAAQFEIYNGDYDWWAQEGSNVSIPANTFGKMKMSASYISDVDATIQLGGYVGLSTASNVMFVTTPSLSTYYLKADEPQDVIIEFGIKGSASLTKIGTLIRSLTSGANIVVQAGSFTVYT